MRKRITHARGLALVFCALALLLPAWRGAAISREGTETREGRLRVFDDVWESVRVRYYDPALGGLDWDALGAKYRAEAVGAGDQRELYTVLRRMLAHLRDPHTRVFAPGESIDWRKTRFVSVGISLREVAGEILVSDVERDSEAERAGVRAGDALVSVDGERAHALLARRLEELQPSPPPLAKSLSAGVRLRAVGRLFDGPEGAHVALVFRGESGREKSVALRRVVVMREPSLNLRREGRAVLVEFNLFTQETAAGLVRALKNDLKDARGLVIDLRGNGGGDVESMTDAASLFLPPGRGLGRFNDRAGRATLEPKTRVALLSTADAALRFNGPVVILVGPRTASAAEVFAAALKEEGRAVAILGEQTCGCVLGIRRRHVLPDGGTLDISEMDYRTAQGTRLEGAGLSPDEKITPTRRSLRAGKDETLKRAVNILKAVTSDR